MKFTKLKIRNFLTIKEIDWDLNEKGLVLIQGENRDDSSQDSNGAGKSSIPDAISWCLFGVTARGEAGDKIVNRTAKKNCQVTQVIIDGDIEYTISRYRKHSSNKNRLIVFCREKGVDKDLTLGTDRLTQDVVNKIVGCSEEVFNAAIYAGQDSMADLPGMTDKNLKTLVEESAGIDRLQLAHKAALVSLQECKGVYSQRAQELVSEKHKLELTKEFIVDREKQRLAFEEQRTLGLKKAVPLLKELKAKIEAEQPKIEKIKESLKKIDVIRNKARAAIASVDSEKAELKKLHQECLQAESESSAANYQLKDKEKFLESLYTRYDSIKNSERAVCNECGKAQTEEEVESMLLNIQDSAQEQSLSVESLKNSVTKAENKLKKLSEKTLSFEQSMTDISEKVAQIEDLTAKERKLSKAIENHEDLEKDLRQNLEEMKRIKSAPNPEDEVIEKYRKKLATVEETIEELEKNVDRANEKVQIAESVVKVFGPAGVRAHILDSVTPFLNARTSDYLSTLTDENITAVWSTISRTAKGELREKFVIDVNSKVGAANFKGLSGGEKRKVRLACSMALQDLVSSRATKPIELYIADEIDHALDEAGLERLMSILHEKATDKGTALVISHNSLSDWIRTQVTVVKENGYSHLESAA